jgi:UDP-N-acetylglucosamine:LPS N-acetylglucosamine transferase
MTPSPLEQVGAWCLNALWSLDATVYNGRPHSAVFIGELEDIPDGRFGWALPNRRDHARRHYDVVGHAINFHPQDFADRQEVRTRLGYADGPLVICSVGGTAVGRELLELCGQAYPLLSTDLPDLQLVLVCGPRIEPESVRAPAGVRILGNVPRLWEHFACCDAAVVQCGGTSTTELAALRTPFVYLPVEGHFEQEGIAERLARHGLGERMSLAEATPDSLAQAIRRACGETIAECPLPVEGARKAADHILGALDRAATGKATQVPSAV